MCRNCNVCGQDACKMSHKEAIERGLVTFDGKMHYVNNDPIYPIARCHICNCSWISDVGGFRPSKS